MRRFLIIALISLLPICGMAQRKGFKLVEKNPTEKPKWLNEVEREDYIYVKGVEAATLPDAKGLAMINVIDQIAQSVAVKISGEIVNDATTTTVNDKSEFKETYVSKTKTKIAKMKALQGFSIQNADIYYEHYYCKKQGETYYSVSLRYPFSAFERRVLIDDYNKQEKAINDTIDYYNNAVETVSSIEEINNNITILKGIKKELEEDDSRVERINTIINLYNNIFKSTIIEVAENKPGRVVVKMVYDGRVITTSQKPQILSNCAQSFDVKYYKDLCYVTFDSCYCYSQDDNEIKITFKAGVSKIQKRIKIKL